MNLENWCVVLIVWFSGCRLFIGVWRMRCVLRFWICVWSSSVWWFFMK